MRNFRFLLASALLMLSLGAWAAEKHADLSIATHGGSNGTWTPATNTYAWTANNNSRVVITDIVNKVSGDLTGWTLVVVTSGYTDGQAYRVDIKIKDNSTTKQKLFYSDGKKELSLSTDYSMTDEEIAKVEEIRINTGSNSGSIIIKDVYLKNDAATPFSKICSGFTTVSGNGNCYYNTATKNFSWTAGNSNTMQIFEMEAGTLLDYVSLHFTTSDLTDGPYRVLFMEGNTTKDTKSFYSAGTKTIELSEVTDAELITSIRFAGQSAAGNLTIDASSIYFQAEEMSLNSPIGGFEWYVYSTDDAVYGHTQSQLQKQLGTSVGQNAILYGPYIGDGKTAYMDVTDYDAMGFTVSSAGTAGLRLLYGDDVKATVSTSDAGAYTQSLESIDKIGSIKTKNESVTATTFSEIHFTKSFEPCFSAAWSFAHDVENTTVSYNRTFTVGRWSTIWLPFDLTEEEAEAAGTFYEFVAFDGSNLGFNPVAAPMANTPYLFEPAAAKPFAGLTKKIKASTEVVTDLTSAAFKGTMAHKDDVTGGESGTVYGYNAVDGEFVKVTGTGVSIDAFRAYVTIPGAPALAPAKFRVSINKTPTAIETVENGELRMESTKVFRNGQLYILRDGKTYTIQGQIVQ